MNRMFIKILEESESSSDDDIGIGSPDLSNLTDLVQN